MIEALHENWTYELSKHFLRERKRTCWNMIEHVHDSKGFPAKPLSHGFWPGCATACGTETAALQMKYSQLIR